MTRAPGARAPGNPLPMTPAVEFDQVTCTFAARGGVGSYTAVKDVTLRVAAGEFVSVVGPTGCGKSTLLNVVAGLLRPSSGTLRVFGEPLAGINRRAGYMFQSEALMPWRTALDNVATGLEFGGSADSSARRRASAAGTPRNSSPAATLSSAVRHGINASDWNM